MPTSQLRTPPTWAANFPPSSARPSPISLPGLTPASTTTVRRVLEENNRGYDMWQEERRYAHNHFPHAALARYALGAPPALIQAGWEHDRAYLAGLDPLGADAGATRAKQIKDTELPDVLTRDNWADPRWLGKKSSYSRYIVFFHKEVARLGVRGAIDEYIFSAPANAGPADKGPTMLMALMAGVLHPFIHLGYGLEFGDPVIVAEGLAQACLHPIENSAALFPSGWPQTPLPAGTGNPAPLVQLYAEFLTHPSLDPGPYDPDMLINERLRRSLTPPHVADMHALVARWDLADMSDAAVEKRSEEVAWLATLLTGATTRPGYAPRVDFFLMHLLTSALFIPSYMAVLDEPQRRAILQSYALTLFQVLLVRGRPHIFPKDVMRRPDQPTSGAPLAPRAPELPHAEGRLDALGDTAAPEEQNPWLEIVANAIVYRESHVPKSIRSLAHFAQKWGGTPSPAVPGARLPDGTEAVPGLAGVDGSLFVRVAGLISENQGWVRAGANEDDWDRSALGWDGAWAMDKVTGRWGGGTDA